MPTHHRSSVPPTAYRGSVHRAASVSRHRYWAPLYPSAPQGFVNFDSWRVPLRASGQPHRYAVPPYPSAPQGLRVALPCASGPLNSFSVPPRGRLLSGPAEAERLDPGRGEAFHPSPAERSKPKKLKAGSLLLQQVLVIPVLRGAPQCPIQCQAGGGLHPGRIVPSE